MPRIIYIRNPSSGSNFRTIGDGSGGGSRPPKAKKPPKTKTPSGAPNGWTLTDSGAWRSPNGAIYQNTGEWRTFGTHNNYSYQGQTPYTQEELARFQLLEFQDPTTLLGDLYDIWVAHVAQRGNVQYPYGTPGTLVFGAGTAWQDFNQEQADAGRSDYTGYFPGTRPTGTIAPNAYTPRPAWLQKYESIANYKIPFNPYWFFFKGDELE
jgi:hypothetical protein